VELTLTEFDILRCLAINAGEVVSRDKIIEAVWSSSKKTINNRTIDVHIRSIRKKIPDMVKHLTSIYGVGYRYEK
jgi:DNA-binding response OmpR family regulator